MVTRTLERAALWEVQTPQVIEPGLLRAGFELVREKSLDVTDDVSIIEALGKPVKITSGSYKNIKVSKCLKGGFEGGLQAAVTMPTKPPPQQTPLTISYQAFFPSSLSGHHTQRHARGGTVLDAQWGRDPFLSGVCTVARGRQPGWYVRPCTILPTADSWTVVRTIL